MKKVQSEAYVEAFLNECFEILNSETFNPYIDFSVNDRDKNNNFMNKYQYSLEDAVNIVRQLTVNDYCESDIRENEAFIFGKKNKVEIYIKIITDYNFGRRTVICISFHEAEYEMVYPYRRLNK